MLYRQVKIGLGKGEYQLYSSIPSCLNRKLLTGIEGIALPAVRTGSFHEITGRFAPVLPSIDSPQMQVFTFSLS